MHTDIAKAIKKSKSLGEYFFIQYALGPKRLRDLPSCKST